MPTERLLIQVDERGARVVSRNIAEIGASAEKSGGALSILRKALLLLGGAAAIKRLLDFADTFTNIQNRVRVVTKSIGELNVVTEQLFGIAQRTRSSFEGTTEVFSRTALAVRELGISQQQTLDFTESLNQAIILSGASAQEANAGMIQLSQGLASGTLRGDELRSVLEQLPVVADVIAKELGVTRGELRKMGEDGKITADIVLNAFKNARKELSEKFAKSVPSIGQSFVVLRNAIIRAIGEFDRATGATQSFAKMLIFLADNMSTVGRVFAAVSLIIGVTFAQQAIGKAIAGIRLLTLAIAANPIGALLVGITAAIAALIAFSDRIFLTSDGFVTLQDFALAAFSEIKLAVSSLSKFFQENFGFIATAFRSIFGDINITLRGVLEYAAEVVDNFVGLFVGAANASVVAFQRFPDILKTIFIRAFNSVLKVAENAMNKIITVLNKLPGLDIPGTSGAFELIKFDGMKEQAEDLGATVQQAFLEGFNIKTVGAVLDQTFVRAEQIAKDRLAKSAQDKNAAAAAQSALSQGGANLTPRPGNKELQENLQQLRQENELLKLQGIERQKLSEIYKIEKDIKSQLTAVERDQIAALIEEQALLTARAQLLQQIQGPQAQLKVQEEALNQLLNEGIITIQQYNLALAQLRGQMLETGTTAAEGFSRGFQKIKADILDVANAAEKTLVNAWHSAEDALVEFVTTGEVNFSKLVDSILADLTRLLARQALAALINAVGGAGGGAGGLVGGVIGALGGAKADGGPVNSGRAYLVGERGPELFRPNAAGTVVPNESLTNTAAAPPPNVNVQVINVDSEDKVPEAMSSQKGDKVILNSLTRNRAAVKNALGIA